MARPNAATGSATARGSNVRPFLLRVRGQVPGHSQGGFTPSVVPGEAQYPAITELAVELEGRFVAGADLELDFAHSRHASRVFEPLEKIPGDPPPPIPRAHRKEAEVGLLGFESHDPETGDFRPRTPWRFRDQDRGLPVQDRPMDAAWAPGPAQSVFDVVPRHPGDERRVRDPSRPMGNGNVAMLHPVTIVHPGRCNEGQGKRVEVKETVIRRMTRLAVEHGAVNLSQGFTDEAPVFDMVWGGVTAMLGGTQEGVDRIESMTVRDILDARGGTGGNSLDLTLKELLAAIRNPRDQLNQYSFPFGIPELRNAIANYTEALYGVRPDPEEQITVVLGASEGMAVAFRSLLEPGDEVVVMQPYHELYPSQAAIFGLVPRFVTLREDREAGTWRLDRDELCAAAAAPSVKAFVVNSPQNPTGKVLDRDDLSFIAELCREHDLFAITDEIYEHITFDGHPHLYLASFDGMADRTLVVNSISKTGRSTGWRIGWVITPPETHPTAAGGA